MEGEAWKSDDLLNAVETAFVLEVTDHGLDHGVLAVVGIELDGPLQAADIETSNG